MQLDITLIIAIIAICISFFTAGWTVYRDIFQRPKFKVSIAIKSIHQAGREPIGPDIYIEALIIGPIPNRLGVIFCQKTWFQRRLDQSKGMAFISSDYAHSAATSPTDRIEVGDTGTRILPYDIDCFLSEDWARVGIKDGYGRTHWAPKKQLLNVREKYQRDMLSN